VKALSTMMQLVKAANYLFSSGSYKEKQQIVLWQKQ
jgi:hypothetical protein